MEHLVSKRHWWFALSSIVIIPGVIALIVFGLNLGIDFTGGTLWELSFSHPVKTEQINSILSAHGYTDTVIQPATEGNQKNVMQIRMAELKEGSPQKAAIEADMTKQLGSFKELSIQSIGGSVGAALRNRAIVAVALASVGILLYIAYAFRNTQNLWLYGICALVAMLHDVLVVLGIFAFLGEFAGVQIDALFVTALLTIIGFSVHDTIVVFDRIRENLAKRIAPSFEEIVDLSLAQTLVRSLNTSMTVILTLLALYLFGGVTTKDFVLALLIGIASGTYSSIFNASQLLVAWENGEIKRAFHRVFRRPALASS